MKFISARINLSPKAKWSSQYSAWLCWLIALALIVWPVVIWFVLGGPTRHTHLLGNTSPSSQSLYRLAGFLCVFPAAISLAASMSFLGRYFNLSEQRESRSEQNMRKSGILLAIAGPLLWIGQVVSNYFLFSDLNPAKPKLAPNLFLAMLVFVGLGIALASCARVLQRNRTLEQEIEGFI